jgi:hypothetical protein
MTDGLMARSVGFLLGVQPDFIGDIFDTSLALKHG